MRTNATGIQNIHPNISASVNLHHGVIRAGAVAAAAEAMKSKAHQKPDKPAHPLPPCLKDVDRQTD